MIQHEDNTEGGQCEEQAADGLRAPVYIYELLRLD